MAFLKNHIKYSFFILLASISVYSSAQSSNIDSTRRKITDAISKFYKERPHEKSFLHIDRDFYISGDTIWYKSYLMAYGKPSLLSKIIYIRLQDSSGKVVKQDMQPVNNGTAYGNINLPDSLHSGWYQLFAFTNWMLNFESGEIYHKDIFIKNIRDTSYINAAIFKPNRFHIMFFPEGGNLVADNINNVAFKSSDDNGRPVNVTGIVLDEKGKAVANLVTRHDGMGSFNLRAKPNITYIARVHFPDSSVENIALPKVRSQGVSLLMLPSQGGEINMLIQRSNQREDGENILAVANQDNGLIISYPLKLDRGPNVFTFKKNTFSTGILYFTVFDEHGGMLGQRTIFVNNYDQLKISAAKNISGGHSDNKDYLSVAMKDKFNRDVKSSTSVAITDATGNNGYADNICSYFFLSSEVRRQILNPGYYFKNYDDTLFQQLDLVMLTNTWRAPEWDKVMQNRLDSLKFSLETTFTIAGKIQPYDRKKQIKVNMLFINSDSTRNVVTIVPDENGLFAINDYSHRGSSNIDYQVVDNKGKQQEAKVILFKRSADTIKFTSGMSSNLKFVNVTKNFADSIKKVQRNRILSKGIILKNVEIKGKKLSPMELLVSKHVKHLQPDRAFNFDLIKEAPASSQSIFMYLLGRIPGLIFSLSPLDPRMGINFTYRGVSSIAQRKTAPGEDMNNDPLFYIDEERVSKDEVATLSIGEVALIQYAPSPVSFAPLNGGPTGALLIYTRRFFDDSNTTSKANQFRIDGYSTTSNFHGPFTTRSVDNSHTSGTTLYWCPNLNSNSQTDSSVRFLRGNFDKPIKIEIEALDSDGFVGFLNSTL